MSDSPPDEPTEPAAADDEVDRRRLIRWIAALAFGVPIVVELLTFGGLLEAELFPGGENETEPTDSATASDRPDAVGVGDELLTETAATETITISEVRQDDSGRTYVFSVEVENDTDAAMELRTGRVRLREGGTVDGVSSTGRIEPGESGMVTAAWGIPNDAMPGAVEVMATSGEETIVDRFVAVERPPIQAV
jgi:hypothetical protein